MGLSVPRVCVPVPDPFLWLTDCSLETEERGRWAVGLPVVAVIARVRKRGANGDEAGFGVWC